MPENFHLSVPSNFQKAGIRIFLVLVLVSRYHVYAKPRRREYQGDAVLPVGNMKKRVSFDDVNRSSGQPLHNLIASAPVSTSQGKTKGIIKKDDVKKSFIRHTEVPVKNERAISLPTHKESLPDVHQEEEARGTETANKVSKFAAPELNSTLRVAREIKNTKELKYKGLSSIENVPPLAKGAITEKVAGKLNFPPEQKLYRDLIDLNICDDELIQTNTEPRIRRTAVKDEVPKLSDYFTPNYDKEYCQVFVPAPRKLKGASTFDGFFVFNRQKLWEPRRDNI